ncbi:hypothetical protein EDD37DRAFT_18298 [Exophiala viscosa]|uniref:uncharacterized protein n=1 Tax=Exophiala viscosa TaxID=2486360 RepID=UPI002193DFB6|nr:hypothetical protein EDD37DRAFT_18298 [Exophiala viscosa]
MLLGKSVLKEAQTGSVALCARCQQRSGASIQDQAVSSMCHTAKPPCEAASVQPGVETSLIEDPVEIVTSHQHIKNDKDALASVHIQQPKTTILSPPPELIHLIAGYLDYPDLLSLKLSHPYFTSIFASTPTVTQRVSWVLQRNAEDFPIPQSAQLSFRSDRAFVANREVNDILRRRRLHIECVKCENARAYVVDKFGKRGRIMCFVTGDVCPFVTRKRRGSSKSGRYYIRGPNGRSIKFDVVDMPRSVGRRVAYEMSVVFGVIVLVFAMVLSYLMCIR